MGAGATVCTHLGNGCPATLARRDNIVQRLLACDEPTARLVPDGIHLPPFVLKNAFRAEPPGKAILTTDAMAARPAHRRAGIGSAPPGSERMASKGIQAPAPSPEVR
jgi:N-acetylglucosamine-6-phosphate deacetylase